MSVCGCLGGRTKFHFVMKKKNFLWLIAFALLMPLFALTACSDDDDDDDNDSTGDKTEQTTNDGTKVLSKKVTKIVITYDEECVETYIFDTDGRLISCTDYDNHDVGTKIYTYNDNTIIREKTKNNRLDSRYTFNIENGRIVSEKHAYYDDDEEKLYEYTYSSDGYLASRTRTYNYNSGTYNSKSTYSVSNQNIVHYDYESTDTYTSYGIGREEYSEVDTDIDVYDITYNSKLNDLNVDLSLLLIGGHLDVYPFTGYYGKRIKNLPLSISHKSTREETTSSGTDTRSSASVHNFTYTYDGDYPTKIVDEYVGGGTSTRTYEIFYNE